MDEYESLNEGRVRAVPRGVVRTRDGEVGVLSKIYKSIEAADERR